MASEGSAGDGRATHRCADCKTDLTLVYDDRDDTHTSPVCGECGGTNVHALATDGGRASKHKKQADRAEHADKKPKKTCDWEADYGGRPCTNTAVKAGFSRVNGRVNDNGIHVSTKTRIVWLCEEHAGRYPSVPDWEASVKGRTGESDGE